MQNQKEILRNKFYIRAIQAEDNLKKLSLGNSAYTPLKTFLKKSALNFHRSNIAKTYVLINEEASNVVCGYITLTSSQIAFDAPQRPQDLRTISYEYFPTTKIARLAIDQRIQQQGLGSLLINWCSSLIKTKICPHIGCRFLSVEAKPEAVNFYKKMGFELLEAANQSAHPHLFLDLNKAA